MGYYDPECEHDRDPELCEICTLRAKVESLRRAVRFAEGALYKLTGLNTLWDGVPDTVAEYTRQALERLARIKTSR